MLGDLRKDSLEAAAAVGVAFDRAVASYGLSKNGSVMRGAGE